VTQNLPIGAVTSPHAVRVQRRPPLRRLLRPRLQALLTVAGIGAAAAGVVVSLGPGQVSVTMTPASYDIGGNTLVATSPGVFRGAGGAALVVAHSGGETRAGASAVLNGVHTTGRCTVREEGGREVCDFTIGRSALSAVDTRTSSGWHRRYDDGRTVDIAFSGRQPVPVPFAVGR
jgi:hypothetical protein